jgi:hypothetical protein
MKLDTRQRWLLLGGLLAATLAAAAWVGDRAAKPETDLVVASEPAKAPRSSASLARAGTKDEAPQVNLEKLKSRDVGKASRDPFALPMPRAGKPKPPAPAVPAVQPVAAPPPPPPTAPPLPFTYMGKLISGNDVAVFLTQGERNLVVREGETIDSSYRVERIAEGAITLTYLPLNQRQTIQIGAPQ